MKILLVVPMRKNKAVQDPYPPIGLGYLATAIRNKHEVKIVDCLRDKIDLAGLRGIIKQEKPGVVGITVWSLDIREVKNITEITKQEKCISIIGGPHPSGLHADTLRQFESADFAFCGEGEIGFPLFLGALVNNRYDEVPGLIWRNGSGIKENPSQREDNLDALGMPSWDLIEPQKYCKTNGEILCKDTAVLSCTRGCPHRCTFCSAWMTIGRKVRKRSVPKILEEIEYLRSNYGARTFDIPDENFTADKSFVMEFCGAVKKYKRAVKFFLYPGGIRLDTLDREVLMAMREAGFVRKVPVGIESGSERTLKAMNKRLNIKLVEEKVNLLNSCGFKPTGFFILGFPGETLEDMKETLKVARRLKLHAAAFSPFEPIPGAEATWKLIENGELPKDFDYNCIVNDLVTYAPKGMTKEELNKFRKYAILKFNLTPRRVLYCLSNFDVFKHTMSKVWRIFFTQTIE